MKNLSMNERKKSDFRDRSQNLMDLMFEKIWRKIGEKKNCVKPVLFLWHKLTPEVLSRSRLNHFIINLFSFKKEFRILGKVDTFYTCDKKEFKHFELEVREKKKIKYLNRSHGIIGTDVALFVFRTVRLARGLVVLISR